MCPLLYYPIAPLLSSISITPITPYHPLLSTIVSIAILLYLFDWLSSFSLLWPVPQRVLEHPAADASQAVLADMAGTPFLVIHV